MKKFVKVLATGAMALSFVAVSAMAGKPAPVVEESNGMPSGAHFQFNMIGHPNGIEADENSNGRTIMIPLEAVRGSADVTCADGTTFTNSLEGESNWQQTAEPKGVKIIFTAGTSYEITDRDATDGEASVVLDTAASTGTDGELTTNDFEVYIRVLGKPSQCMKIDGYVEVDTGGWLHTGNISLSKNGRPTAEKVTDMFTVDWCVDGDLATDGQSCSKYVEYSVFDNLFGEYFWDVQNNGTKIVQVRFYPIAD